MIKAIEGVFQTPIAAFEFNDSDLLNSILAKEILDIEEKEKASNNFQYSMTGPTGYHTRDDLLLRHSETFKDFETKLKAEVSAYYEAITGRSIPKGTQAVTWAMVYRKGDHSLTHTHPDADISAAYYIQVPESIKNQVPTENGGALPGSFVYLDPRPAARFHSMYSGESSVAVLPQAGTGLIFPGWLEHYTIPMVEDDEPRICIAINFFIPKGDDKFGSDFYKDK